MATQRVTAAAFAGKSAQIVQDFLDKCRTTPEPVSLDSFCISLRQNASSLHVLYYSEWIDRWLMGDQVPGPFPVVSTRFQAACFTPQSAIEWAAHCGNHSQELRWFTTRLQEAVASANTKLPSVVVILREVIGPSATDEELLVAQETIPVWLSQLPKPSFEQVTLPKGGNPSS